jgi:hypothetical protein
VFGAYGFVARQNTPPMPAVIRVQKIQCDSARDQPGHETAVLSLCFACHDYFSFRRSSPRVRNRT